MSESEPSRRYAVDRNGHYRAVPGSPLSYVEMTVARMAVGPKEPTNKAIASILGASEYSVRDHLKRIYVRTGVNTRLGLYKWMLAQGLFEPPERSEGA